MIVNVWRHSDARARIDYMQRPKPKLSESFAVIGSNTAVAEDVPSLARSFSVSAQRRPEVRRPFLHLVVAANSQGFDRRTWHRLTRRLLELLGLPSSKHIYYAGLHRSDVRQHCHILVSRVAVDGTVWHGQHERQQAIEAARVLDHEYGLGLPFESQISEHHRVSLINRVLRQEELPLIDPHQIVEMLTNCLHKKRSGVDGFIFAASRRGIELEIRPDASGGVKGLCLVLPTKRKHRLALSHVTNSLFSWRSLKDFYDEGSGRLLDHFLQTMSSDPEQTDWCGNDEEFGSDHLLHEQPDEAPEEGWQSDDELPYDENTFDQE